jgi:NAD(P)-dependent dehydrogenase (short-subunit alcohol dehydrogenase family)
MDLELTDKVAVVTGAGKGIGLAVTRALAAEGARVIAGSRTMEALDDIDGVSGVAGDLAAPDGPAELIARAIDEHGRVDVLVNNVGAVRIRVEGFFGTSDEEFEWAVEMNFMSRCAPRALRLPRWWSRGRVRSSTSPPSTRFFQPDAGTIDY